MRKQMHSVYAISSESEIGIDKQQFNFNLYKFIRTVIPQKNYNPFTKI